MSKNIAILFSGGLDSTYLMWKALSDGHDVYPIYIEIRNNDTKSLIEKQQCELIIKKLNNEFKKDIRLNKTITVDVHNHKNLGFAQPFLWSTLVNVGLSREISEVQIGYVYGDAVIAYIPEIKKTYNSAKPFIKYQPKLTFPAIKVHKDDIIYELPRQYRKLIVSCENIQLKKYSIINKKTGFKYRFFEPCGDCEICKKIIENNYYGCDETKKNYKSAEKKYNGWKYDEFRYKHKGESMLIKDGKEILSLKENYK